MTTKRTCADCEEEFYPSPNKPGYINQCPNCADDVPLVGGNMIWDHKTAPTLEIKTLVQAKSFAKRTRRFGAGVLRTITTPKEPPQNPGTKANTGAGTRDEYRSRLGERRYVKS